MKNILKIILGLIIIGWVAFYIFTHEPKIDIIPLPDEAYAWVKQDYFYGIAHRMGPSEITGENRIATFHKGYEQGFRFFEVDLMLTTDQHLICYHGTGYDELITYQQYVDASHVSGFAPCDINDLIQLAQTYPDVYFILDVKNEKTFAQAYQLIKDKVSKAGVGYSFIPQIYAISESPLVREGGVFSVEIYTGYRLVKYSTEKILNQARQMQIPVVTLEIKRVDNAKRLPFDLLIFTHPVNDLNEASALKQKGITGIFTRTLSPLNASNLYIDNR